MNAKVFFFLKENAKVFNYAYLFFWILAEFVHIYVYCGSHNNAWKLVGGNKKSSFILFFKKNFNFFVRKKLQLFSAKKISTYRASLMWEYRSTRNSVF